MHGMKTNFILYQTEFWNSTEHPGVYEDWMFKSPKVFDTFALEAATKVLYKSHTFEINKEQIRIARLRMTPEVTIKQGKNVTNRLFGMPWDVTDLVTKNLIYQNVLDTDIDNMIPVDVNHAFNSSDIYIPILPDFVEREYNYKYFLVSDITAAIGGIGGFLKPIMSRLVLIFIISFLW